jgi:hypothetical protein
MPRGTLPLLPEGWKMIVAVSCFILLKLLPVDLCNDGFEYGYSMTRKVSL